MNKPYLHNKRFHKRWILSAIAYVKVPTIAYCMEQEYRDESERDTRTSEQLASGAIREIVKMAKELYGIEPKELLSPEDLELCGFSKPEEEKPQADADSSTQFVIQFLADRLRIPEERITSSTWLFNELAVDMYDIEATLMQAEDTFNVQINEYNVDSRVVRTVSDLAKLIDKYINKDKAQIL